MVVDSSVVIAIALREPGYELFVDLLRRENFKLVSVASMLECTIVVTRKGASSANFVDLLLRSFRIHPVDVTQTQLAHARQAFLKYGKGIHPAALNFGDCFSYALSKTANEPLLFKGADFSQTDIVSAL